MTSNPTYLSQLVANKPSVLFKKKKHIFILKNCFPLESREFTAWSMPGLPAGFISGHVLSHGAMKHMFQTCRRTLSMVGVV
jgi:hypothetical protein